VSEQQRSLPDVRQIAYQTATIDRFGHLYYADHKNRIIKLDEHGDSMGYYANNSFGQLSIIDATNPLKVLAYFPDFYTGVVLDRLLNQTQVFNMLELGFGEIRVIGSSIDGAMWIFNDHEQRIVKANQLGQTLLRGEDLRLRFNQRLLPTKLIQAGSELFMLVPNHGILVFDLFGQYKTQILDESFIDFQVVNARIVVRSSQGLEIFDPNDPMFHQPIDLEVREHSKILIHQESVVMVSAEGITRSKLP
jgi:hypothetical protein